MRPARAAAALAALAALALAACEERGTITAEAGDPCAPPAARAVAAYLKTGASCDEVAACGLAGFECADGCVALCAGGYCTADEWAAGLTIDPPAAGTYALVVSYRYDQPVDEGLVCFVVEVAADGTSSATVAPARSQCCRAGGGS